jgi:hypothetical protein
MHYFLAWLLIGAICSCLLDREGVSFQPISFVVELFIWPVLIYTTLFHGYRGNDKEFIRKLME